MHLNFNDKKYEVIVNNRSKKNFHIRVGEDLKVHVSATKYASKKNIENLLYDNYNAITKMIEKQEKNSETKTFLGKEIDIIEVSNQTSPEIYNNKLYIKDKNKLDEYYKRLSYDIFKERLDEIYKMFNEHIPYPELKIRKMKSRWGVCNKSKKTITINSELIKKDIRFIDYVIIHELCHFIYFDHSKYFWDKVGEYCSDYKILKKSMKEW